jgi:alkylation response protein AidB-like acyl-CoA dehydrogenase
MASTKAIRQFVADELCPDQDHFDNLADQPLAVYNKFRAAGLANWWLPKDYGGLGLSLAESGEIVNELAYGDAGVAVTLFISSCRSRHDRQPGPIRRGSQSRRLVGYRRNHKQRTDYR